MQDFTFNFFLLQMSHERRRKAKDIVLKIGDKNRTIQGVTDHTTCGDVIKMMLRKIDHNNQNAYSYAIFECGNESKRMLSDKTKVLKTMRTWGSGNSKHFSMKAVHQSNKIFKAKQDKTKTGDKLLNNLDKTRNIENATKLAHFVQSQKTRLQRQRSNNHVTELYRDDCNKSINEFISNVDQTKMAGFLDFCGTVSANELERLSGITNNSKANKHSDDNGFVSGNLFCRVDKINDVKYATKKVLKPKRTSVTYGRTNTGKHTFVDSEYRNVPTLSTPTRCAAKQNLQRHKALAESITSEIARVGQRKGKDIILQKYFAAYLSYNSPNGRGKTFRMPKRERGDGAELNFARGNPDKGDGSFSTGSPLRRTTAGARCYSVYSDSDSGQEDHDHEDILDNAFICKTDVNTGNVDSNFRYAHIKLLPRKLVNYDVTMATQTDKLVDYSFNDTSDLESDEDTVDILERNVYDEDDEMLSFMDSKLHDDFSDEGLSSLGSEDEREILV